MEVLNETPKLFYTVSEIIERFSESSYSHILENKHVPIKLNFWTDVHVKEINDDITNIRLFGLMYYPLEFINRKLDKRMLIYVLDGNEKLVKEFINS